MGYFLTAEPRRRMAAESLARPKTHTPGSRVSNLGSRNTQDRTLNGPTAAAGLEYKVALGLLFACSSDTVEPYIMSSSAGRIFEGQSGVWTPVFLGAPYHVSGWVAPGAQGTRP